MNAYFALLSYAFKCFSLIFNIKAQHQLKMDMSLAYKHSFETV